MAVQLVLVKTDGSGAPGASLVPCMTDYTVPSGVASASSEFSTLFRAWHAFDCGVGLWGNNSDDTAWLQYQFASAVTANTLELQARAGGPDEERCPNEWQLLGSNTGAFSGEEVTIHSITGGAAYGEGETKSFTLSNPGSYIYYRLNMTGKPGSFGVGSEYVIQQMILRS